MVAIDAVIIEVLSCNSTSIQNGSAVRLARCSRRVVTTPQGGRPNYGDSSQRGLANGSHECAPDDKFRLIRRYGFISAACCRALRARPYTLTRDKKCRLASCRERQAHQ